MPNLSTLNLPSGPSIPVKGVAAPAALPKFLSVDATGRVPLSEEALAQTRASVKMTLSQFGRTIKEKYPVYAEMDDEELGKTVLDKYPQYAEKVALPEEQPGFWKGLGRAIVEPFARIGASAGMSLGMGLGKDETTDEYGLNADGGWSETMKAKGLDLPALGNFKPLGYDESGKMKEGGALAKDVLGNSIQAGLSFMPATKGAALGEKALTSTLGRFAPEAALKAANFGKKLLPRAIESAGMGVGYQAGMNLSEGKPLGEGMGTAALFGAALPVAGTVAGKAGKKALASTEKLRSGAAERVVNSLIKPLGKDFAYGKNPGRGVAQEGIIANSLEELTEKVSKRRAEVGKAKGDYLAQPKFGGIKLDTSDAFAPIDDALVEARKAPNTNAALITRLEALRADAQGLGMGEALGMVGTDRLKQELGQLAKWTGNASDDKLVNKAIKMTYGRLKEKLETVAPELRDLNERFGDLLSAEIAAKYRDVVQQRLNLVSLGGKLTGIGGAIGTVIATGGTAVPAILAGIGMGAIQEALGKPFVKTRVAVWLAKAGNAEKKAVFGKVPALRNAIERVFGSVDTDSPKFKLQPKKTLMETFGKADGTTDEDALLEWMVKNDFKGDFNGISYGMDMVPEPSASKAVAPAVVAENPLKKPLKSKFDPNSVQRIGFTESAYPREDMEDAYQTYKKMVGKYKKFDGLDEEGIYYKFKGTNRMKEYQTMFGPAAGGGEYGLTSDDLLRMFRDRLAKEEAKKSSRFTKILPDLGPDNAFGFAAGFEPEYDENGRIKGYKFNPKKSLMGFAGVTMAKKLLPKAIKSEQNLKNAFSGYRGDHQISKFVVSADKINLNKLMGKNKYGLTKTDYLDLAKLKKMQGKPEMEIKIYRASPVNELNNGDWVTTRKDYAQDIKKQNGGSVYEYTVKAKDLKYPDDIEELPSLARFSAFKYEP